MSSSRTETQVAVLEAAWERLSEHGPDALKLGQVASDAGVSRQAIYLNFESRGGLLLALVDYIDEKLDLAARLDSMPETDDPVEHACNVLRVTASYAPSIQEVALAFQLARHDDEDVAAAYEDRMTLRRKGLRRGIEAVADAGRLRDDVSVDFAVDTLWAMGLPSFYDSLVTERGWTVDEYSDLLVRTFRSTFVVD